MKMNNNYQKLESYLNKAVVDGVFPGANFAIVDCNNAIKMSVGNKTNLPVEEKNDLDTIYDLASLSKVVVTTTLILKLMEDGVISLKTPLTSIIPDRKRVV